MKKTLKLLVVALLVLTFSHCNDDDEPGKDDVKLDAESNKELIQNIGIEFVNEMSNLQQLDGVGALTSFGVLVEEDDEEGGRVSGANSLTRVSKTILGFSYGKITAVELGHMSYRMNGQDPEDDEFSSFEELFNENTGTYTWDFDTEEFVFEDNSTDEVIFVFPSEQDGTSNNAELTLSNYSSIEISNPLEDYEGDLPTSLDLSLAVDGSVSMTYGFEIDYNNDGVPEQVDTELTIGDYSLAVDLTNTQTKVGAGVNFSNASKTLIAVSTEVNGDFSDEAISNTEDSEDPTEVISNGNFSFTLIDLMFSAELDFAGLYNDVEDLDLYYEECCDDSRPDLEGNAGILEASLQDHAVLKATYVSSGKTAADVEFYTTIEEDEEYGEEYVELGARMIFEDGSKVDVQDFLETGFDNLEDAINDLLDQIADDLGEEIDHLDFSDLG